MSSFDAPNVVLPLAVSYNGRAGAAYTSTVTNAQDQRKVNLIYTAVRNALSGNTTLKVSKRPGAVLDTDNASLGSSGQVAYLAAIGSGLGGSTTANVWVFSTSGNDIRASDTSTTTVIRTAAGEIPLYVDKTSIGGNDNVVVQIGANFAAQTVWYSTAIGTWTQITDGDFPDIVGKMEFMDGYAFALSDSAQVQRVYNSDINSLSAWTSTSYLTKQIQQDRTSGLARLGNIILAFGQETVEAFHNVGNPVGSPLAGIPQLASRVGLEALSAHYYCTIGSRIFFVSRSGSTGRRSVYMFDGSRFEPVSTPAIDKILSEQAPRSVNTVSFAGRQAVALSLTATSAATQRWLMFFPELNEWFEWDSTVICPVNSGAWHLGTGSNQHKLYNIASGVDNWADNGTNYDAILQFQLPSSGNNRQTMEYCAVDGDTSRSAHTIDVQFSDDDGQTYSTARPIDMTSANKTLRRCGTWKGRRMVRLVNSANLEGRMEKFMARVS